MDIDPENEEMLLILVLTAVVIVVEQYKKLHLTRQPYRNRSHVGWAYTKSIIGVSDITCRSMLRMSRGAFFSLFRMLRVSGLLSHSKNVRAEEQLVMFLHTLAHNAKNRVLVHNSGHSGETISRYCNIVLSAILKLYPDLLKPPSTTTHEKISGNHKSFYPYFKDCIGSVDGSHINAWVPVEDHSRFRDRHRNITQNILAACDHDTRFTYILSGWEGSASDARILDDAIHRQGEARLVVPGGKYYLVDAGFANQKGFLRPYRNVRYHLKEWKNSNLAPANKKELFNMRHSRLRSVIERAFGLLKSRFKILKYGSEYPFKTQAKIVIACALIHNHILTHNSVEEEEEWIANDARAAASTSIAENTQEERVEEDEVEDDLSDVEDDGDPTNWEQFREDIADKMWADWVASNMDSDSSNDSEL